MVMPALSRDVTPRKATSSDLQATAIIIIVQGSNTMRRKPAAQEDIAQTLPAGTQARKALNRTSAPECNAGSRLMRRSAHDGGARFTIP
jgi:hypothetical protein